MLIVSLSKIEFTNNTITLIDGYLVVWKRVLKHLGKLSELYHFIVVQGFLEVILRHSLTQTTQSL